MPSLYDDKYKYTEAAHALSVDSSQLLRHFFKDWMDAGYSPREISQIVQGEVIQLEHEAIIENDAKNALKIAPEPVKL